MPLIVLGGGPARVSAGERRHATLAGGGEVTDRAVAIDVFNELELVAKLNIRGITACGV